MESVLVVILYGAIILFIYNYFIYPVVVIFVSKCKKDIHVNTISNICDFPTVSFIIAAYNEEKVISDKIKNTLSLDYPSDKFQIIVVSDGSNDKTVSIVKKFQGQGVISLHNDARNGKSAALNRGVEISTGEIIVFSDANNDFSNDAIKKLTKHFNDPVIGAVTGAKHIYDSDDRQSAVGDGLYWKYESKIKEAESTLGSITGAEGEILAVRASLFEPLDKKVINDDAEITFNLVKSGYRVIYEKEAKAYEQASHDLLDDFNVKVRMTAGGYQTLSLQRAFLFPPRSWYTFSFLSHKLLRWLAPHFMLVIFITPLFLLHRIDMLILFICQIMFYTLSLVAWFNRKKNLHKLLYIPMYFTVMNIALFWGFVRYFNKNTKSIWKKAER